MPRDYGAGLAMVLGVVWVATVAVIVTRWFAGGGPGWSAVVSRSAPSDVSRSARTPIARRSTADHRLLVGLAIATWALIIGLGRAWGLVLESQGRQIILFTPPVLGGYRHALPDRFGLAVLVASV